MSILSAKRAHVATAAAATAVAMTAALGLSAMPAAAGSVPLMTAGGSPVSVAAGHAGTPSTGTIDGRPILRTITMTATAYGPSLQDNYPYGATDYFGQPLRFGMVAVDPSVIPLGTTLYIQGYNDANLPSGGFVAHALDEGGAIQGSRIDIFMPDGPSIVSNFGVQTVTVDVLGPRPA